MTVEQFMSALQEFGQSISGVDSNLLDLGGRIVNEMKSRVPVDTGELRNSLTATLEDNSLTIQMLTYGMFQNYGVDGMTQRVANDVPTFGVLQPRAGRRYGFSGDYEMIGGDLPIAARKHIYQFGLKPQPFFDTEALSELVATEVTNRLDI